VRVYLCEVQRFYTLRWYNVLSLFVMFVYHCYPHLLNGIFENIISSNAFATECVAHRKGVHSFLNQMHYNIHTFSKFVRFKKEYYKHICRNTQISTPFKSVKKC
jgi:hypothetical protein